MPGFGPACAAPMSPGLAEILFLSTAMPDAAREQDWVAVTNLEAARDALLKTVLEGSDRPAADAVAAMMRKVLDSDRQLIELGKQARDGISAELAQLRQSRKARSAYAEHGGD